MAMMEVRERREGDVLALERLARVVHETDGCLI
jgi:hypothetical protein